jgi:putative transposase
LVDKVEKRLLNKFVEKKEIVLIELECEKDHIHILVDVDPQYGV